MPELDPTAPAQSTAEPIELTPREPAAPVAVSAKKPLMDLTDAERLEWRTTGNRPDAAPAPVSAPAPKPEEPRTVSKRQLQINDYERRIAEQDAELARLRSPKPAAAPRSDPQTQPAPVTLAETIARPDIRTAPLAEGDFYTKFPESGVGDYADYRASYRYAYNQAREQQQTRQQAVAAETQTRVSKATASIEAASKTDPAFMTKIAPLLEGPTALQTVDQARKEGKRIGPEHVFATSLIKSDVAAQILQHLADHPETLQDVRAMTDPEDVLTYFGELQARYRTRKPAADQPPPPKTFTDAPDPPVVLGNRPGEPVDPVVSALKRRDTGAYIREMNARDLAARRG